MVPWRIPLVVIVSESIIWVVPVIVRPSTPTIIIVKRIIIIHVTKPIIIVVRSVEISIVKTNRGAVIVSMKTIDPH
jgi:predicted transcriptional regulator